MKLKIYMVTYKGHKRLEPTLTSLFASDIVNYDYEVNLINNHTDIRVPEEFKDKVNVLHNVLRPDWSSGHLSRNWNQALINGFGSLSNPLCDIVVCSQDDSIFRKDWASKLVSLHNDYSFIQNGHGDQFHSYLPEAVCRTGLWDERFCGLSRQAADYFWRCVMYNMKNSTIQDTIHHRVINPIFPNDIERSRGWLVDPDVRQLDKVHDNTTNCQGEISERLMSIKYPFEPFPWTQEKISMCPERTVINNFITYPYFEKDIYNLREKGYII